MNQYQFEQILRRMERRYGKIRKGQENEFLPVLNAMEHNLYQVWCANRACNGRRVQEAVLLALYRMEDRLTEKQTDVSAFETPENLALRDALLAACDPLENPVIYDDLRAHTDVDPSDLKVLEEVYSTAAPCMMRIRESAQMWTKERGADGYFTFVEGFVTRSGDMMAAIPALGERK